MKTSFTSSAPFFLIVCIALGMSSCKTVYHPNSVNTPLFSNGGEFRGTIDPSNVQLAYAITDHAAVMLNGFRVKENTDNNSIRGQGGLVEAGFGYYTRRNLFIFETFVGGGMGGVKFQETRQENNQSMLYTYEATGMRFFIQPSVGIGSRFLDVALTPRFVLGKYNNISTNYSVQDQIDGKFYQIDRPLWAFIEPALTVRVGYEWIKLQAQFGLSQKLNSDALSYKDNFFNLGISINLFRNYDN